MNLIEIINQIKVFMKDFPERYKDDKREAYKDMESFIVDDLSPEESKIILTNAIHLMKCAVSHVSEGLSTERTKLCYPFEVPGMYLMMIRTNKEMALSANKEKLFLIVQLFGGISYFKYDIVMKGMFDERIIKAINECSDYTRLYETLYELVETLGKTDNLDMNSYMNKFVDSKVYHRLYVPEELRHDNPITLGIKSNVAFLKDMIGKAEKVNMSWYQQYLPKMAVFEKIDQFSIESMQKYLECDKVMISEVSNLWKRTDAELTLLNIMQYISIEGMSVDELAVLVNKMKSLPLNNYQEIFSTHEKLI